MEKVWLKSYPQGVDAELGEIAQDTIVKIFENSFGKFADRPAFECLGRTMTFSELDEKSKAFAAYLQNKAGMKKGDRIALMSPNLLPNPVASLGALRAGLTVVNVNPLYTPRELEHQLNDSGAEALIVFVGVLPTFAEIAANTPVKSVMVIGPQDLMADGIARPDLPEGMGWFHEAVVEGLEEVFTPVSVEPKDIAFLQYTGGTTGLSKGATLSHYNVAVNVAQTRQWLSPKLEEGNELIVTALPLYHIFALTVNMMIYGSLGGCNLLIPNPRDMDVFIGTLKGRKFTAFTAVNTLFNGMMLHPEFKNLDFSNLKVCIGGGTKVQEAVANKWQEKTGNLILEGYGLSETSPVLTVNPVDGTEFMNSIGLPLPSTEIKLLNDEDKEPALGESGELCARGPQVMQGYWNKPEETAKVMTSDGFFRTGDVAIMTEDGYFKIVDRKKDMILVSGFNVYPNEIEGVLAAHVDIVECACIGVPDDKTGEAVKVFAVRKQDSGIDEDVVRDFCRDNLTAYKVPKHVTFIDEIPKSAVGKILRRELRDL